MRSFYAAIPKRQHWWWWPTSKQAGCWKDKKAVAVVNASAHMPNQCFWWPWGMCHAKFVLHIPRVVCFFQFVSPKILHCDYPDSTTKESEGCDRVFPQAATVLVLSCWPLTQGITRVPSAQCCFNYSKSLASPSNMVPWMDWSSDSA